MMTERSRGIAGRGTRICAIFGLGLLLVAAASCAPPEFADITPADLEAAMAQHSVVLLDANGSASFRSGHIPSAIDYAAQSSHLAALLPSDKSSLIVAYCANEHCPHYLVAARAAAALGYTRIRHFAPGIAGWIKLGRAMEAGVELPPIGGPIAAIHAHLCGFHFYAGDLKRQVRAEHYCSHVNQDVWQCLIYDSDQSNARLIGVEYIISEKLFQTLPEEEKKLWHSHRYEVMSGELVAPGIPSEAETSLMKDFVTTYGKTWHLWQIDRGDRLPLGLPKLMMGFTGDGQADPSMVAARDQELAINPAAIKAQRAGIPTHDVAAGADAWQRGPAFQISDRLLSQPASAGAEP